MADLTEEELQELYAWIDEIPLTRQKKNITRDFSDGVLAAEVVHHFLPKLVELHNYSPANALQQKIDNWRTLNRKVLSRVNFVISEDVLQGAANGKQGVIEFILITLRSKIENYLQAKVARSDFSNDNFYMPPDPLDGYPTNQTMTTYQQMPSWDGDRHTGAAPLDLEHSSLNRTYPTGHPPTKFPLLPSRIPISSKKKDLTHDTGRLLPPISTNRQDAKATVPQTLRRRHTQYSERTAPLLNGRSRDNSAKYKLRLAEKDQRILETHEYIQFLQMKLTRYEHLVQVKDMKIEELKRDLEAARNGGGGRRQPAFPYHQKR